ncbi:MAG: hypothetical protein ABW146_07815, partial [Candidatus Sedimenticola sp. 6PFRAG7]
MIGSEVDMPGKRTSILIAVLLLGTGLLSGCDRWFDDDSHQLLRIGHQSNISTLDQYATTMRSTLD